jgi:dienelactone hydrolase
VTTLETGCRWLFAPPWFRVASAAVVLVLVCLSSTGLAASGRPVAFVSHDGTPLAGMVYEATARPSPGVVLVHMLRRSKDEWTPLANRLQQQGATVLAFDLRGHGGSGGDAAALGAMSGDVRAAVEWLATRPGMRGGAIAVVGASLGANLAVHAAAGSSAVAAVALVSPSLDYRGVRLDAAMVRKLNQRPVWFAASSEDPYALRTLKDLAPGIGGGEQHLTGVFGHGTPLLLADPDLAQSLVDWLRRTLIF